MHGRRRRKLIRLWERDFGVCSICLKEVIHPSLETLNSNDGSSADHIIPWARGGSNHLDNLRLAHRECNSERHHHGDLSIIKILSTMLREGFTEPLDEKEVEKNWREKDIAAKNGLYKSGRKRSRGVREKRRLQRMEFRAGGRW